MFQRAPSRLQPPRIIASNTMLKKIISGGQTDADQAAQQTHDWLCKNCISVLNIAGPRASKDPAIYEDVLNFLEIFFV